MKKVILIPAFVLISAATFAQSKTDSVKSVTPVKLEVKKSKAKVTNVIATVAPADSVNVSVAELKAVISGFYQIVDDSSDISRKASKIILKQLADFYNKYTPDKPADPKK